MKIALLLLVLILTACGGGSSPSSKRKTEKPDQVNPSEYIGDFCSPAVLNDFLNWRKICKTNKTVAEAKRCKVFTQEFLARYPGMNCELPKVKDMNGEELPSTLTEADLKDFVDLMTSFGH